MATITQFIQNHFILPLYSSFVLADFQSKFPDKILLLENNILLSDVTSDIIGDPEHFFSEGTNFSF